MQVLGIVRAFWGSVELPLKEGSSFKVGGLVNKPVIVGKTVARAQVMAPSEINLKVAVERGMVLTDLFGASLEQELQLHTDVNQTFVWESAFRSETLDITTGDSSGIDVKFTAGAPMELING